MTKSFNIRYREQDINFYAYLESYSDDCYCMWRKKNEQKNVYSIERLDILSEFRRKGLARKLLNDAIEHIKIECPQACIEITAEPDTDSGVTIENLVAFYESLGFEKYLQLSSRVHLRLYLDDNVKPHTVYDNPFYFR